MRSKSPEASSNLPASNRAGPISVRIFSSCWANGVAHQFRIDAPAVLESGAMVQPLPNLGARNLRRGGVFHQVVDGHAAVAAQPGFQVLNADVDVQRQALFGDLAFGHRQQIGRASRFTSSRRIEIWLGGGHVLRRRSLWRPGPGRDAPPRCRRARRGPRAVYPDAPSPARGRWPPGRS